MRISDWSSDVCSSDLAVHEIGYRARLQYVFALLRQEAVRRGHHGRVDGHGFRIAPSIASGIAHDTDRARHALRRQDRREHHSVAVRTRQCQGFLPYCAAATRWRAFAGTRELHLRIAACRAPVRPGLTTPQPPRDTST